MKEWLSNGLGKTLSGDEAQQSDTRTSLFFLRQGIRWSDPFWKGRNREWMKTNRCLEVNCAGLRCRSSQDVAYSFPDAWTPQAEAWSLACATKSAWVCTQIQENSSFLWFCSHHMGQGYHVYWLKYISKQASVYMIIDKPLVWSSTAFFSKAETQSRALFPVLFKEIKLT